VPEIRRSPEEILGIVGPSGCGKTTLLCTILGLLKPRDGQVDRPPSRSRIGRSSLGQRPGGGRRRLLFFFGMRHIGSTVFLLNPYASLRQGRPPEGIRLKGEPVGSIRPHLSGVTMQTRLPLVAVLGFVLSVMCTVQAQVTKETVPGITNFARVETTVACAGATTPAAIAEVKRLGFKAVVNLRQASEAGADIDGEAAAAKAAGINFVHLPFNAQAPDPMLVERFLKVVTDPGNQPAFIHCASGNRAAALWLIKRVEVDKWSVDRASEEATALGLTSSALKTFALDQLQARAKQVR
jgi:uncharacterized protein (TIGR01244 family)